MHMAYTANLANICYRGLSTTLYQNPNTTTNDFCQQDLSQPLVHPVLIEIPKSRMPTNQQRRERAIPVDSLLVKKGIGCIPLVYVANTIWCGFKHFLLAVLRSGVCIFVFSCVVFLFGCFFSALNSLGGSSLFLVTGRIRSVNNQQSFRSNKKHISQQLFIYLYRKRNCFFQPTQPKGII